MKLYYKMNTVTPEVPVQNIKQGSAYVESMEQVIKTKCELQIQQGIEVHQ